MSSAWSLSSSVVTSFNLLEPREIQERLLYICVVLVFFCCNILALVVNLLEVRERWARLFVFCVVIVFFCCNILALEVNLLEVRER
jgi:hypothetical protein